MFKKQLSSSTDYENLRTWFTITKKYEIMLASGSVVHKDKCHKRLKLKAGVSS